jgi:hypothetical protein
MNILEAISDERVFAPWFKRGTHAAWIAFLCALFGLSMNEEQLAVYRECTGRTHPP